MMNFDIEMAKLNLTKDTVKHALDNRFSFNYTVMGDVTKWMMYDGFLAMYVAMKFVITAITLSCAIPGGIFTPTFAIGAVFG